MIADRRIAPGGDWLRAVESALAGGATAVMLREKDLALREKDLASREKDLAGPDLHDMAVSLREATRRAGALLIVNHEIDAALAAGADGVHLGWRSPSVRETRARVGSSFLIGVSTHSVEEALRVESEGADYVTFGPVFPTPSKEGWVDVQGLEGVRRVRAAGLGIPLVGLGGIDAGNASEVFEAGADGVAMIRGLMSAAQPDEVARRILGGNARS
ncbi:thiamine phosphate synthase [Candidatus Sumerlaeota bacterium]|nr:thiamine phosphate synthase [Candidatus Sumerlaeota bacterium]